MSSTKKFQANARACQSINRSKTCIIYFECIPCVGYKQSMFSDIMTEVAVRQITTEDVIRKIAISTDLVSISKDAKQLAIIVHMVIVQTVYF